jgi:hypothetical protein
MMGLMRPWQYSKGSVEDGRGLEVEADEVENSYTSLTENIKSGSGSRINSVLGYMLMYVKI